MYIMDYRKRLMGRLSDYYETINNYDEVTQ